MGKVDRLRFYELLPWTLSIILSLLAIGFGIAKFENNPYSVGINAMWITYHLVIFAQIFKLNSLPVIPKKVLANTKYYE